MFRKGQQYDCKWYIPLADLAFQTIDESESSPIPQIPEEDIDALKVKISQMKNEIQREKVETVLKRKLINGLKWDPEGSLFRYKVCSIYPVCLIYIAVCSESM